MIIVIVIGLIDLQLALLLSQRFSSLNNDILERESESLLQAKDEEPCNNSEDSSWKPTIHADCFGNLPDEWCCCASKLPNDTGPAES